jgi:hypothetical protein
VLGVMSLGWMAVVAVVIFVEKVLPRGGSRPLWLWPRFSPESVSPCRRRAFPD